MSFESETMKEISSGFSGGEGYCEISLIGESSRCRLYSGLREGKRFLLKTVADTSGKALAMLKREYEMSLTFSHPGIAYVFAFEDISRIGPCIVMEYVDGVTLDKWLETRPSLKDRKKAFGQLLDAVEYIHSRGAVHNDLAPQNILVSRTDGRVKLIDFGFADDDVHYLQTNLGCTKGYASAELLRGRKVDARSDVWSLGMLMRDFFGRARYGMIASKCTRKNPLHRYRSVAALRSALKFTRIFPYILISISLFATLIGMLWFQHRIISTLRQEQRQRIEAEAYRDSVFTSLKGKVNQWYEENVFPEAKRIAAETDPIKQANMRVDLANRYYVLWYQWVDECPEEYNADFTNWLLLKFNKEFPIK